MKKELCAMITIALLIAVAVGNLIHLNQIMDQIVNHISYCQLYCSLDDYAAADTEITKALQVWEQAERFTHVFIRHSEIDSVSDLFYDVLAAISDKEKHEADYLLKKLQHHTDSIVKMEQLSLGSIF